MEIPYNRPGEKMACAWMGAMHMVSFSPQGSRDSAQVHDITKPQGPLGSVVHSEAWANTICKLIWMFKWPISEAKTSIDEVLGHRDYE